ncbi:MAG TPA: MFS transporter [Bacteroidia bacterium]|nr:MFS transporter [Bacteroidia bacterium]
MIGISFLVIQPLFMKKEGFTDGMIAGYTSLRFLGVLCLAFPLGLIIKGRKLKKIFYAAGFGVPTLALLIIYSIAHHIFWLIYVAQFLWGVSLTLIQIPVLPYILRNEKKEFQTEAIALSYSTGSFAGILSGFMIAGFNKINPFYFDAKTMLIIISFIGFLSLFFIHNVSVDNIIQKSTKKRMDLSDFDWKIIMKALFPTLIIAVGAGLTIPFISLFFASVHHMSTGGFAFMSSIAAILVAIGAISVPKIKRKYGYQKAIPTTQSLAVIALVLLATTQYYSMFAFAIYIAIGCYLLRQPLMNMAGPMTSELIMNYVGYRNQEIISALSSAIWSGSWFFSSIIFKVLRDAGFAYANVFLITATLYAIGVVWYYFLILDYNKRVKLGLIE